MQFFSKLKFLVPSPLYSKLSNFQQNTMISIEVKKDEMIVEKIIKAHPMLDREHSNRVIRSAMTLDGSRTGKKTSSRWCPV